MKILLESFYRIKVFLLTNIKHPQNILIRIGNHYQYLKNQKKSRKEKEEQTISVNHPKFFVINVERILKID